MVNSAKGSNMTTRNLFTPAFGGLPKVFFGRKREMAFARAALQNANSPYRAFFITGNRGCGKTTLLEKISQMAAADRWVTIDVHSTHATQAIIENLAGGTQRTTERSAHPTALGVTIGGISTETTLSYTDASLAQLLIDKSGSLGAQRGILITVDEIQKVSTSDAENLCAAVQLAFRKGRPVMLVLAGLPRSKEKVASYPGCTFMQRAYDMKIGCLEVDETIDAFRNTFDKMPSYEVSETALWEAGLFSQGYPYLMQLLGYYAVERLERYPSDAHRKLDVEDIKRVEQTALADFRENVLSPILDPLSSTLESYLRAMCEVQGEDGRVCTHDVAQRLGKTAPQVSSYRQRLIERRLIEADGHGYARFVLPHIREYYQGDGAPIEKRDPLQQWNRYR